ncbi:response regulator transcription factor [Aestuariirhabdus sp. Z084]|nr:response regulator transcription factor [Aestuariirhabdus haliotis]MCL6421185.1 response regulator transcription factor [Aestuariirhabdus haliotis]
MQTHFAGAEILQAPDLDNAMTIATAREDLDLILLDLNMPGMQGLNGLVRLSNESPTIPVVIISAEEEKSVVLQAMTCGAVGFIVKSLSRDEILSALDLVLAGQVYLPSDVIRSSASGSRHQNRSSGHHDSQVDLSMLSSLTRRQLLVLEQLATGDSNKQIAYNLSITEATVKVHVSAILRKLQVTNRLQAVLYASHIDFSQPIKR